MATDTQTRKWHLTINNPLDKGFDHAKIREATETLPKLIYYCMCDEIGEQGTPHTHLYIYCENVVRFSRIKKLFPEAHIEQAKGTSQSNRDYIRKEGKWEKDKKKETNLIHTFEEYGDCPVERQGARNDLADLLDMVKFGMSNYDIINEAPQYLMDIDRIERVRQTVREEEYKNVFRDVYTTYIYGTTGAGKTRGVMEEHGYTNVYRVTDYDHPFDGYKGEPVIIFEEFRSSLKVQDMLNYLDGYPLQLPCRYANKVACFTKVYIITNISLTDQYVSVQKDYPETWAAFLRRIDAVKVYSETTAVEYKTSDFLELSKSFRPVTERTDNPFTIVV